MLVWIVRAVILVAALLSAPSAEAQSSAPELVRTLESDPDFRLRVQAALELGRSEAPEALQSLFSALNDDHASVRVAAAAALKIAGKPQAIEVLKLHRLDRSGVVRAEVNDAVSALEAERPSAAGKPQIFVKMGGLRNGTRVKSKAIEQVVLAQSRKDLDALPGIEVLPNDEEVVAAAEKQEVPVVLVTTSIQRLAAAREGDSVVYSAIIEYLVHTMPGQAIMARVAGRAEAAASREEALDRAKSAELRREVVEAAVRSALRRAPQALLAAAYR